MLDYCYYHLMRLKRKARDGSAFAFKLDRRLMRKNISKRPIDSIFHSGTPIVLPRRVKLVNPGLDQFLQLRILWIKRKALAST